MIKVHFAGINSRDLAAHTRGQDVLVSYADLRSPGTWAWIHPMIEGGHFRSVILDSGAFTVYAKRMREIAKGMDPVEAERRFPDISISAYRDFVHEHGDHFDWVTNMDDIGGKTEVSNANFEILNQVSNRIVPVWHEGEGDAQLRTVIAQARANSDRLAVGMQRPKGSLVPRNVVACLTDVMPKIRAWAPEVAVHGFGLTRYASAATCPCGGSGWAFESVDSTTWIAEACAVERSGAAGGRGIAPRATAFRATVDSYHGVDFIGGSDFGPVHGDRIDIAVAIEAGGQAKTVASRF